MAFLGFAGKKVDSSRSLSSASFAVAAPRFSGWLCVVGEEKKTSANRYAAVVPLGVPFGTSV